MIRRYLPWLFLIAAVCGLIGCWTTKHISWWYAASRFAHVIIALAYLPLHHGHWR